MTSDDEQLAQLKSFWSRYGSPLLTAAVVALAIYSGWQFWQRHQASQANQASALYQQLLEVALSNEATPETARVIDLNNRLNREFPDTAYAQYGRLFVAKLAVESGKLDDAATELRQVLDKPVDGTLGELARERMARVMAAQGKTEDALKLLEGDAEKAFVGRREELRGDLLVKLGQNDKALEAYQKAKTAQGDGSAANVLQLKLDDLAKGEA